jgi:hypothetical protein
MKNSSKKMHPKNFRGKLVFKYSALFEGSPTLKLGGSVKGLSWVEFCLNFQSMLTTAKIFKTKVKNIIAWGFERSGASSCIFLSITFSQDIVLQTWQHRKE